MPNIKRSFTLTEQQYEHLNKIAIQENVTINEVARRAFTKYIEINGYTQDIDFIAKIVRKEIEVQIDKAMNRSMAMSNKNNILATSNYFLLIFTLLELFPADSKMSFEELERLTRNLGIELSSKPNEELKKIYKDIDINAIKKRVIKNDI